METEAYQTTVFEAEQKLLANIIADSKHCGHILLGLKPIHFADSRHQVLFSTLTQIISASIPVDLLTLKAQLIKNRQLEIAGGLSYVNALETKVAESTLTEEYFRLVLHAAQKRMLAQLGGELCIEAQDPSISPSNHVGRALQRINEINADIGEQPTNSFSKVAEDILYDIIQSLQNKGNTDCVYSGFTQLDSICNGFHRGELIVVAGRPAIGKTAFSISLMMYQCLQQKLPLAYFSLEASAKQIATRILAASSEIPSHLIATKQLNDTLFKKLHSTSETIRESPLYFVDEPGLTIQRIRFLANRLKRQYDIQMIVVDYIQLIASTNHKSGSNRAAEIAEITRGLKNIARELDIPVVVISQLSRAVETRGGDKKPILSDLRESGAIEQEADKVLFIYRGEYYGLEMDAEGNSTKNIAEIIVAKNRLGPVGTARMQFNSRFARFENLPVATGSLQEEVALSETDIENRINQKYKIFGELRDEQLPPPF